MAAIGKRMTSQKNHNNLNQSKNRNAKQPPRRKWLVALLILPIFIIGYLISSQPSSETIVSPVANSPALAEQAEAIESTSSEADADSGSDSDDVNNNELDIADEDITVTKVNNTSQEPTTSSPKAILNAPLPATNSLAKEEIDRLADERARLKEQEAMVAEQVVMTKSLTEMKAEQIDLLEQQIAELEAEQAAQ